MPQGNPEGTQLTDGLDLLATHLVQNILWCGVPRVSCVRPKSNRTQACTSGGIGSAAIRCACFQRTSTLIIIRNSVLHTLVEGLDA